MVDAIISILQTERLRYCKAKELAQSLTVGKYKSPDLHQTAMPQTCLYVN